MDYRHWRYYKPYTYSQVKPWIGENYFRASEDAFCPYRLPIEFRRTDEAHVLIHFMVFMVNFSLVSACPG
jgi:hypothetical protein